MQVDDDRWWWWLDDDINDDDWVVDDSNYDGDLNDDHLRSTINIL